MLGSNDKQQLLLILVTDAIAQQTCIVMCQTRYQCLGPSYRNGDDFFNGEIEVKESKLITVMIGL